MTVLLRTADGLEAIVSIPKFVHEVRRPVIEKQFIGKHEYQVIQRMRCYSYIATRIADDVPIYTEVADERIF